MDSRNWAKCLAVVGLLTLGIARSAQAQSSLNTQRPQRIEYSVEKAGDSIFSSLRARDRGRTSTLIDESKKQCFGIVDQRDWDGNGLTDALVERITACGGNCCPNSFFFVSALGNGRFAISDDLADSWAEPVIEKWRNHWSVVITSNNEGFNTDAPVEIRRRFILQAGKGIKVEESRRKDMESILEMRSDMFEEVNNKRSIEYDLDGDGRKDVISGELWARWGRINWGVRFANGKEFTSALACKRIGVLPTKTNGVNDLVCDQDQILRWNGQGYK